MDSRPPPPQGSPPSYAFVTRVYRRNLRPVVIATAFLAGLWTLLSAIGFFRGYGIDKNQNFPQIANLSVALGALYLTVFVIGALGVFSAVSQRVALVRIYAILAALATLIVIAAGLTRIVTHFIWKNDIISECTNLSEGNTVVYNGFWGPVRHDVLNKDEAAAWCKSNWDRASWSEIVAFLIISLLAALFTALAFSYYRQLLDPTSVANASRAPSNQVRMGAYPSHYTQPYNASVPNLAYNYGNNSGSYTGQPYYGQQQYAPPAGAPLGHDDPFAPPYEGKPPGYVGGDGKGYGDGDDKDSKDPFSDFDGQGPREERDVTSRPAPGGRDTFH